MSSNLFTPSLRYTNKDTCNSAWTFIDGQNVSDIEVPKFIKNLFTSFDDSRYGKMGKDLIEGFACTQPTTDGYDFSQVDQSSNLKSDSFNVDGIQCATGWGGLPHARACTSDGPYTVTGCNRKTCADPDGTGGGNAFNCSGNVNDLTENPTQAVCNGDQCTPTDCCTQPRHDVSANAAGGGNSGNISCTKPTTASEIPAHVNQESLPPRANFSHSTGDLISGQGINPSCVAGYSDSPHLRCSEAGAYQITGCERATCTPTPCQNGGTCALNDNGSSYTCHCPTGYRGINCETEEDQTTYTCSSAFEGATTGKDQPCNLNAPESADWTKGDLDDDPLWAKYDTGKDDSSLTKDESDAIKDFITNNTGKQSSDKPGPMDQNLWNKCCKKAECTDEGWDKISITDPTGSWTALFSSWGCTLPSLDTSG